MMTKILEWITVGGRILVLLEACGCLSPGNQLVRRLKTETGAIRFLHQANAKLLWSGFYNSNNQSYKMVA